MTANFYLSNSLNPLSSIAGTVLGGQASINSSFVLFSTEAATKETKHSDTMI